MLKGQHDTLIQSQHLSWFDGEGQSMQFQMLLKTHLCTQCVYCEVQASFVKRWQKGTDPQDLVCEVCVLQTRPLAVRSTLVLALWPLNLDHHLAISLAGQCYDEICK